MAHQVSHRDLFAFVRKLGNPFSNIIVQVQFPLVDQLHRVERNLGDGPWFNGETFSLADTAFAPLFRQDCVADNRLSAIDPATMPKVKAWADRLLALPEVRDSVVDEFEDLYLSAMQNNGSYSLYRLAA